MRHNLGTPPADAGRAEQTERLAELIDGAVTLVLAGYRVELGAGIDTVGLVEDIAQDAERLLRRRR